MRIARQGHASFRLSQMRRLATGRTAALIAGVFLLGMGAPGFAASPAADAAAKRLAALNLADRPRPRVIVTSDVEIDDVASWHRFWLYANEFEIDGLIYTSSMFHWAGDPVTGVASHAWAGNDILEQMIKGFGPFGAGGGYAAVFHNLARHAPGYPTPDELLAKVRLGNISNVGEMARDTPGSRLIREVLLDDRPQPVYLLIWGGTNTVAAALRSIEDEYKKTPAWNRIYRAVIAKARLYVILDQDATYKAYIATHWPDLWTVYNRDMFWSVAYQPFRDARTPPAIDRTYFGAAFMKQIAEGPLLRTYPLVRSGQGAPDQPSPPVGSMISEGDSPSYWSLLATGLRGEEHPDWGGWGGRFDQVAANLWTDRPEALNRPGKPVRDLVPASQTAAQAEAAPQTRWIPALQDDFLARSRWTTMAPATTNHEPVIRVDRAALDRTVRAGHEVLLAIQAADPDGDRLAASWWQYREAGSYLGSVIPTSAQTSGARGVNRLTAHVIIPADARLGDTIHIIAEVTDSGSPPLTRYARFVLTVR